MIRAVFEPGWLSSCRCMSEAYVVSLLLAAISRFFSTSYGSCPVRYVMASTNDRLDNLLVDWYVSGSVASDVRVKDDNLIHTLALLKMTLMIHSKCANACMQHLVDCMQQRCLSQHIHRGRSARPMAIMLWHNGYVTN